MAALGNTRREEVLDDLCPFLGANTVITVRLTAIQAASQLLGERATDELSRLVADSDARVRSAAISALGKRALSESTLGNILARVSDKEPNVRRAALTALTGKLGLMGVREAVACCAREDVLPDLRGQAQRMLDRGR